MRSIATVSTVGLLQTKEVLNVRISAAYAVDSKTILIFFYIPIFSLTIYVYVARYNSGIKNCMAFKNQFSV